MSFSFCNNQVTKTSFFVTNNKKLSPSQFFVHSQVMPLNDLLKSLENHGEVNLKLAEHELSKNETGNFTVEPVGGVCYVLDAKTQKTTPKKGKACP